MDENKLKAIVEEVVNKALEPIKEILDSHSGALVNIESKLDAYADSYKINQHNIERLDTRLTNVEEEINIDVPEDLKVPHFVDQPH